MGETMMKKKMTCILGMILMLSTVNSMNVNSVDDAMCDADNCGHVCIRMADSTCVCIGECKDSESPKPTTTAPALNTTTTPAPALNTTTTLAPALNTTTTLAPVLNTTTTPAPAADTTSRPSVF